MRLVKGEKISAKRHICNGRRMIREVREVKIGSVKGMDTSRAYLGLC